MSIAIRLQVNHQILSQLYARLQKAYTTGQLRLVKRIHPILYILHGKTAAEVAVILTLSSGNVK